MTSGVAKERQEKIEREGEIRIMVQCTANKAHAKLISVDHSLGMEYASTLAGLLDGSSRHFIHKPGPNSPLGKCGVCQAQIKCTVEERLPENAEPQEQGGEPALRILRSESGGVAIRDGATADTASGAPDAEHAHGEFSAVDRIEP
jgi:hypothetical protein